MSWALLGLLSVALAANVTQAFWLRSTGKDKDAARDVAEKWKERAAAAQEELRLANLTIQAREAELAIVKERLATAEDQRNESMEAARDHFVRRLQDSKIADAAKLVADLLASSLHGGVLPEAKPRSEDPVDGLENPFTP